jgi:hypothetical protein
MKLEIQSELSEKMLLRLIELKHSSYTIPTMNIFNPPNELQPSSCNWFNGLTVTSAEFLSQVFTKLNNLIYFIVMFFLLITFM